MKIVRIIVVVLIAAFLGLPPILGGYAPIPGDISAREIGEFIGGLAGYWIEVLRSAFYFLRREQLVISAVRSFISGF